MAQVYKKVEMYQVHDASIIIINVVTGMAGNLQRIFLIKQVVVTSINDYDGVTNIAG